MPTILIVDDEPDILRMLGLRLKKSGYHVVTAVDGEEALSKVNQDNPDLILLDVHLPKIKGDEIARRLKESDRYKHIPIVFITADARAENLYADGCLIKPFDGDEMVQKIESYLIKTS